MAPRRRRTAGPSAEAKEIVVGARRVTLPRNAAKPLLETDTSSSSVFFLIAQMLFCVVGINMCFGWWSVKQERVIKQPYSIPVEAVRTSVTGTASHAEQAFLATTYGITLLQTFMGFLVSAVLLGFQSAARTFTHRGSRHASAARVAERKEAGGSRTRLTMQDVPELFVMGLSNIFGSSLGYAAMRRLSYPISLTSKMCKMLPVMLVGSVWYHTRYPASKILACLLITSGVVGFALLDLRSPADTAKVSTTAAATAAATPSSSFFGLLLMVVNLLMDGYTNSTQDVLVKRHQWSGATLMMWTNLVSVVCATCVLLVLECGAQPWAWLASSADLIMSTISSSSSGAAVSGMLSHMPFHDFSHFITFLARSEEARRDVLLMSLLNAVGQLFIFHTISLFGTLAVTAMTLIRKSGSVLLSIYVHGHAVQPAQWVALSSVFVGIVAEGYMNVQTASRRQQEQHKRAVAAVAPKSAVVTPKPEIVLGKVVSPPTMSSSSSTAVVTNSRSATPACATTLDGQAHDQSAQS